MSDNFTTILIVGASSGLGEGFARRFHAQGKKVIATGRRLDRLQSLQSQLPGLAIHQMDVSDTSSIGAHMAELTKTHPTIDAVIAMAGIQRSFSFQDPSAASPESIAQEVTTNVTAPMVLAHAILPHLLSLPSATFVLVSSGLAFVPVPLYPVYCPTKSAIHSFALMLRAQMSGTNVRIVELAPPYVDTELDVRHREMNIQQQGGEEKAVKPMGLEDYLDQSLAGLKEERKSEVAVGFADMGLTAWRGAFGPILEQFGMQGV